MTDETTQALLPCPFCGGEALRFTLPEDGFGNGGGDVITCTRCEASSHVEFGRKENLVDRWNTRLAHSLPSQADATSGEEMRLREALLPCDVTVAPTTVFRAGVKVGTLLDCIEDRRAAITKGADRHD